MDAPYTERNGTDYRWNLLGVFRKVESEKCCYPQQMERDLYRMEENLIVSAQQGDAEAFQALVERYSDVACYAKGQWTLYS